MLKLISYKNITPKNINHGNIFYSDPLKTKQDFINLVKFLTDMERITKGHCDPSNINIVNIIPLNME